MLFETLGDKRNPAVLFFHAMGVTGASSEPVAGYLQKEYFCILPTSTVYCQGQKYIGKADEVRQLERFLQEQEVKGLALVVASSIGADLAMAFLVQTRVSVEHVFFDGGQFARIGKGLRRFMTPFLYFAIKSLYWSGGKTLKKILWCDDDAIKPYFIAAGKALRYGNLHRQMADSLEDTPFGPCRLHYRRTFILPLAAARIISSIGMRCKKHIRWVISRYSRDMRIAVSDSGSSGLCGNAEVYPGAKPFAGAAVFKKVRNLSEEKLYSRCL